MIVVDTSAFVSLTIADSLGLVLDEFDVRTTESVIDELADTAAYDDVHGVGAADALDRESDVSVHRVSEPGLTSSRIDRGEASCLVLTRERDAAFLVTDDLRALPELRNATAAEVAISPFVLKALVKRGALENGDALDRLETLAESRDWLGAPIYRRARTLFDR